MICVDLADRRSKLDPITAIPLALRGAERIAIVAVAALCIYLGYKLFKIVPDRHEGEGSLSLGDLSISLSKIGPGVFFSLFGAVILFQALQSVIALDAERVEGNRKNGSPTAGEVTHVNLNWMGSQDKNTKIWVDRASAPIMILNCLERKATGSEIEKGRITEAIHQAKVAIMADVWQEEWGGSEAFLQLSLGNVATNSKAGAIYHAIEENCSA